MSVSAAAQPEEQLPAGTVGSIAPATAGTTEIEGQGKFEATASISDEDVVEFDVSSGAMLSTGNSQAFSATLATRFLARMGRHQFGSWIAGNYGRAAVESDEWETNATNLQGRLRYDVFMSKRWTLYAGNTIRHDTFQGLDLRLNVGPGVGYYFIVQDNHRLWTEVGYDFQYDMRTADALLTYDADGVPQVDDDGEYVRLDPTADRHAVRLFVGYSNRLSKFVTFDTGIEYLQSFLVASQSRVNWEVGLTTQLSERFSLNTTFVVRYDNAALPTVKKADTVTALNVVYRFL